MVTVSNYLLMSSATAIVRYGVVYVVYSCRVVAFETMLCGNVVEYCL